MSNATASFSWRKLPIGFLFGAPPAPGEWQVKLLSGEHSPMESRRIEKAIMERIFYVRKDEKIVEKYCVPKGVIFVELERAHNHEVVMRDHSGYGGSPDAAGRIWEQEEDVVHRASGAADIIETCACGAHRRMLVNGCHVATTIWFGGPE